MPQDLRTIRRKIRTVTNVAQITRAMKMVAAARLRRCQQVVERCRPYGESISRVVHRVVADRGPLAHPYLREGESERPLLLVVAGDRGLCGSYNSLLFRRADQELEQLKPAVVVGVGDKVRPWAEMRGIELARVFPGFGGRAVGDVHLEVARTVREMFDAGECDGVWAVHTPYVSALYNIPTRTQVLPLTGEEERWRSQPGGEVELRAGYIFEPSEAEVVEALLPRAVESQIALIVLEAAAAEQAARMTAMTAATDNAEELLAELTRLRNRVRQQEITTEILEVVAGADAITAE